MRFLNRALSSEFPDTVTNVLKQEYQFEKFDPSYLDEDINISEDTKMAVDNVIKGGDCANYSVYFATPSQAKDSGFDDNYKFVFNDGDKTDNSYNYYTTESVINELKKYEVKITGSATRSSSTAEAIVAWAEAQVGKSSFYNRYRGTMEEKRNQKDLLRMFQNI